eukprot:1410909-Pleurochrysis_carterae.AAC.1
MTRRVSKLPSSSIQSKSLYTREDLAPRLLRLKGIVIILLQLKGSAIHQSVHQLTTQRVPCCK